MQQTYQNQQGFTLIEILIALVIFAVGLLAIAGLQASSISYNSGANQRTAAIMLAQGLMEQTMALDRDSAITSTVEIDTALNIDSNDSDGDENATTLKQSGSGSFTATRSITLNTPTTGISQISITVRENNGSNTQRLVTLTSYKRVE